jgi:hypothetical protein
VWFRVISWIVFTVSIVAGRVIVDHTRGAFNTYWNIRGAGPVQLPAADFGPFLNFIGLNENHISGSFAYGVVSFS